MWMKRDVVRVGSAIVVTLAGWVLIRLVFSPLDYYPPASLVRDLGPSWFATAEIRQPVKIAYVTVALVLMAVFFTLVHERCRDAAPSKDTGSERGSASCGRLDSSPAGRFSGRRFTRKS